MDFSGYVPPEFLIALAIIVVLCAAIAGFVVHDWILPFVSHHISVH